MDTQNKLIKIPINDNNDIIVFITILMSFYSSYFRDLILNKHENNKNTLLFIVKKLLTNYYNENEDTINFFNTITPEILLLKFLMLSNNNKLRKNIILNNNFYIPITLLYNFYNYLNLVCFNIITINNSVFYCDTNNFYDYFYDKNDNKINYKLNNNDILYFITDKLTSKIDILMIQKEKNTLEANIVNKLIKENSYTNDLLNLHNYFDINTTHFFNQNLFFNNNNYILDSCIIKSNINNNYIILLHFEKNKYIYDIVNNNLIKYDWSNLKKFNYHDYNFNLSPSLTAIYTIIQ